MYSEKKATTAKVCAMNHRRGQAVGAGHGQAQAKRQWRRRPPDKERRRGEEARDEEKATRE